MTRTTGALITKPVSISLDQETKHIWDYFGVKGTEMLRKFFVKKFKLEDEKELEKYIWKIILEKAEIKDNFSEEFRKENANQIIELCKKEYEYTDNENTEKRMEIWIKRMNEYLKNGEYKRGKYGKE